MALLVNDILPFMHTDMNGNLFAPNTMPGQATSDMYMMQRQNMINMGMPGMDQNNYAQPTSPPHKRVRRQTVDDTTEDSLSQTSEQSHTNTNSNKSRKKAASSNKDTDDDERRKNFLERNRQGKQTLPSHSSHSPTTTYIVLNLFSVYPKKIKK